MGAFFSRARSQPSPPAPLPNPSPLVGDVRQAIPHVVHALTSRHAPSLPIPIPTPAQAQATPSRLYSLSPAVGGPLSSNDNERLDRYLPIDRWTWDTLTGK